METPVDPELRREASRFALRFTCDDCAHFDRARAACVHGYPIPTLARDAELAGEVIVFCKEFELGEGEA